MTPTELGTIIGGSGNLLGGLAQMVIGGLNTYYSNQQANAQNALNREVLDWNKDYALTKYQKTVKDLNDAGLSATLATGASPVTLTAPQVAKTEVSDMSQGLYQVANAVQLAATLKKTEAEIENITASANAQNANAEKAKIDALKTIEDTKGVQIDNAYREEKQKLANELTGTAIEKNRQDTQRSASETMLNNKRWFRYDAEHIANNPLKAVFAFGQDLGYGLDRMNQAALNKIKSWRR